MSSPGLRRSYRKLGTHASACSPRLPPRSAGIPAHGEFNRICRISMPEVHVNGQESKKSFPTWTMTLRPMVNFDVGPKGESCAPCSLSSRDLDPSHLAIHGLGCSKHIHYSKSLPYVQAQDRPRLGGSARAFTLAN
jgi:hypothetical protein